MPSLVRITGRQAGRIYKLAVGTIAGRRPDCTIRLRREAISREHARFGIDQDGWYVEDLASTNGIRVNDLPVRRATLREEDMVTIGDVVFRFIDDHLN